MTVYDAFPRGETLVIAHRGARARAPENTLKAFSLAADESAHGIELDVRLARSGEVVVLHDADLARVTEGADPRLCVDLSLDELRRIDVGEGERVPTLLDVLALARERGLFVNVEMKRDVPSRRAVVEAVAPLVRSSVGSAPVVVSSFDPIMLGWLGILVPEVTRALLVHASSYHDLMAFAPPFIGAHGVHAERVLLDERRMAFWKRRGFVCAWTVGSANEARKLARLGVRGIITDDPRYVLRALADAG